MLCNHCNASFTAISFENTRHLTSHSTSLDWSGARLSKTKYRFAASQIPDIGRSVVRGRDQEVYQLPWESSSWSSHDQLLVTLPLNLWTAELLTIGALKRTTRPQSQGQVYLFSNSLYGRAVELCFGRGAIYEQVPRWSSQDIQTTIRVPLVLQLHICWFS